MAAQGVKNMAAAPELWRKLGWTLLLLMAFRFGVHVPVPGVDVEAMRLYFDGARNSLIGMLNMLSGGGLKDLSIFALGVMPYISSSIIMQLLQVLSPDLKRMAKEEGSAGRKKITQYTRYGAVLIAVVQSFGLAMFLSNENLSGSKMPILLDSGPTFLFMTVLTMTTGTMLIMWLGEQITTKGIGNGISLIIFSGIVAGIPSSLAQVTKALGVESKFIVGIGLVIVILAVMLGIIFVERAQRRIPIHYAKRQQGRKVYGGQTTHLPLRLNTAGVIPPIFAGSLLMFPGALARFGAGTWGDMLRDWFDPKSIVYQLFFVALIVFFCFFYTAIIFDPKDIAENLKKQGGFVPGIRPGDKTREYIDTVLTRITLWGAIYISCVCVLPAILSTALGFDFNFGGTSVLIVVGVAMDFMSQLNSYLISKQYEGFMSKAKSKGRY